MTSDDDWSSVLMDHPIFSAPKGISLDDSRSSLELSTNTLKDFTRLDPNEDSPAPSGRRRVMLLKDADLIIAAGRELRMTSLGDPKLNRHKSYKVLHTPNIQFMIHQLALNPNGKLLAVAGAFQIAIVVLPRPGFSRLVPTTLDCKSMQVGQFYHASGDSAPIAKIDWHPWGEAGSTLLVMTVDGKLREYDISVDPDEPQQVLSFVPERKGKSFVAEDASEREVSSFTLGKGRADWGPLTLYAIMRSGDIYSMCPYMPKNVSIPSSYVHALECFIGAKQEFLSQDPSTSLKALSTLYDYQRKYVNALFKQLPSGTMFPAVSRFVAVHPPTTIKSQPVRQGPFLLQPSPCLIEGSEGGDATDIVYLSFGNDLEQEDELETERLGVILIAYKDGKVDVCLDVEKIEAKWEIKQEQSAELPMLAVYETIDLGLVSALQAFSDAKAALGLLEGNHPVFCTDPIHDDIVYVYHAFGVHALHLGPLLEKLGIGLRQDADDGATLARALESRPGTTVQPILTTLSVERRSSNPVIAVTVPNDVYLTYSILILTSSMRIICFALNLPVEGPLGGEQTIDGRALPPTEGPPAYVSLLEKEPFVMPSALSRPLGFPSNPRLALPPQDGSREFVLTPDTLRYLGKTVERLSSEIHEIILARQAIETRVELQKQEFRRQQDKAGQLMDMIQGLKETRHEATQKRIQATQESGKTLLTRLDRVLQAMMKSASPELSEHETKWFEELGRMKEDVEGAGRYDEGSLTARVAMLKREYDRILPGLKEMEEKEKQTRRKSTEAVGGLGFSQAFELGERSHAEHTKIREIEDKILSLAAKLDINIGHPPQREHSKKKSNSN